MITYKNVKARPFPIKVLSQDLNHTPSSPFTEADTVPLFQKARSVLGGRLSYHVDTGAWAVDGKTMPIGDVIALANALQTRRGKKTLLSYPRVAARHDYGLSGMVIPNK